jgi:hypothetical protein
MTTSSGLYRQLCRALLALTFSGTVARAQQPAARPDPSLGAVDGLVADTALRPLAGATVSMMGTNIRVVTGENGHFLMTDLPPGPYVVVAQRLGFEPASLRTTVGKAETSRMSIMLERVSTALDTVRVNAAKRVLARHQEFETRLLNHTATASFSADDIHKRNPTATWQMLTAVSAINVTDRQEHGNDVIVATSRRGMITSVGPGKGNQPCFLKVMVDGVAMQADDPRGFVNLKTLPMPASVYGIEVFAGPASIPVQYTGAGDQKYCGLVAIWTK